MYYRRNPDCHSRSGAITHLHPAGYDTAGNYANSGTYRHGPAGGGTGGECRAHGNTDTYPNTNAGPGDHGNSAHDCDAYAHCNANSSA